MAYNMEKGGSIKFFEDKKIRSTWNEEEEEWYFSVVDVIEVLTDSANLTDYLKKLRKRDVLPGDYIGTNCPQVAMSTETGKQRKTLAAGVEFATLTDIIYKTWADKTAKEYKKLKGLNRITSLQKAYQFGTFGATPNI